MAIRASWGIAAFVALIGACSSTQGVDPSELPLEEQDGGGIAAPDGSSAGPDASSAADGENAVDAPPPDLTLGLVAWYPLRGDTLDATGKGNDAENHGATLVADRFGKANSAYHVDGASYLEALVAGLPLGGQERTITAWVNPDEPGAGEHNGNTFVSWGTGDCVGKMFGMGNYVGMLTNWVGCADFHTQLMLPDGMWSFVAVRFVAPHDITAWVNESSAGRVNDYVNTTDGKLRLGVETIDDGTTFRHWFKGSLSDVRIYDRALTDEEIALLRAGN